MLRQPALSAIRVYQRYISPRKGYGCAYRLAHGGTGCSGYAKAAIAQRGTIKAVPLILRRFADCKQAALALGDTPQGEKPSENRKRKRRWYDYCDFCTGCSCPGGRGSPAKDTSSDCTPDCTPDCAPGCCSL